MRRIAKVAFSRLGILSLSAKSGSTGRFAIGPNRPTPAVRALPSMPAHAVGRRAPGGSAVS